MTFVVPPPTSETVAIETCGAATVSRDLLPGEIPGLTTALLVVPAGACVDLASEVSRQSVQFLVEGRGTFAAGPVSCEVDRLTLCVAQPGAPSTFAASAASRILQIRMDLRPDEAAALAPARYPIVVRYADCERYRDYFKSERTVSRTLIHPFTLPRFAMGSVETTGPDRVEPHAHPMLDQLFFSLPENDCTLLVEDARFHFGANCLLHVPLGSNHGIDAAPGDTVHYLWIDVFARAEDMDYLVQCHTPVAQ